MPLRRRSTSLLWRVSVVALALIVLGVIAPGAVATTKQQLEQARSTLHRLEQDITVTRRHLRTVKIDMRGRRATLRVLQAHLNVVAAHLSVAEGNFEATRTQIDTTQKSLAVAQRVYRALRGRIDQRARSLYEAGPGSDLELIFSATSVSDLTDRLEFVGAVNAQDSDLAIETARVAAGLTIKEHELVRLQVREQRQLDALHAQQAQLDRDFAVQRRLLARLDAKESQAARLLSGLAYRRTRISNVVSHLGAKLAAEQRAAAAAAERAASSATVAGPAFSGPGPFKYCPVQGPHAYSDDFGAPRYTTSPPHPHAGNDIFAPGGTPIVAPFDGNASDASGGLGGISVIVSGSQGYVYNAHLERIAQLGSVSAGTVVGYVGNSGDAAGGATHDHFEWHPSPIPSNLWRSPYGYTEVNGAVDPYPYLNQVC